MSCDNSRVVSSHSVYAVGSNNSNWKKGNNSNNKSFYAREQQQQTTSMYLSYMGSADNIWDQTADEDSGETYGDQAVTSSLESIEKMYILKEKASDYDVALTDDDETAIADALALHRQILLIRAACPAEAPLPLGYVP